MDESGIDNNEDYAYGWSEKGKRFHGKKPAKRQERLSIIGALCQGEFFAQAGLSRILQCPIN